ncbi:coiled-coil domain-containing protein 120 [Lissotriton helveticus]
MATSRPGPPDTPSTVRTPLLRGRSRPGTPTMEVRGQLITPSSYSSSDSPYGDLSPKLKAERIRDLMERQRNLQEALSLKLKELKRLCLQEAELTGHVPAEYPLEAGERLPHIRRRVGAVYRMPSLQALKGEDLHLEELDREFTMQQQIVEAARKLVVSADLNAEQRRKRKQVYADALKRLQDLEEQANEYRARLGKKPLQRVSQILQDDSLHSESSSLSESASHENEELQGFSGAKPHLLPDRPSPPRGRDHMRAVSSSPDRRPGYKFSPAEIYCEMKNRRNSVASPTSPTRTFPRSISSFEGRSVPATPVLTRNALSGNHLRPEGVGLQNRQWSGSQDSQMGFPSDRAALYTARSRRSNSSEALIERTAGESSDANEPLYASIKPPFKSSETLTSDRSFSTQTAAYSSPDPHQHLHYQYERPGTARTPRTNNSQVQPNKQIYGELLQDYYLGKQQTRAWAEPDGRLWAEPNGRVWMESDGRVWAESEARVWPEPDGIGHFSRRDGHSANHQDFVTAHPGAPHTYAYMDSPGLRSRAEAHRAKVTRTKSCGPHVPIEPEAQFQQHWQHEASTPRAHYTPRSRSQQRCPGPDPADRRMHKALALEGLRDWYIRNASGHRPPLDRRLPQQPQHQQRYHDVSQHDQYYSSSPMSHSMSFNGPPLASRHYTEYLYEQELNDPLNGLVMFDGGFSLERDVNSPGTLV